MNYLDKKMKKLLKAQEKANREAYRSSSLRSRAQQNIQATIAKAILKGSFLSQEIWTVPEGWVENPSHHNFSLTMSTSSTPALKARWGNVLQYMKNYCYRVELSPGISITYRENDDVQIQAESATVLSAFVKKHGINIICPDVDEAIDTIAAKLEFVKGVRASLKEV